MRIIFFPALTFVLVLADTSVSATPQTNEIDSRLSTRRQVEQAGAFASADEFGRLEARSTAAAGGSSGGNGSGFPNKSSGGKPPGPKPDPKSTRQIYLKKKAEAQAEWEAKGNSGKKPSRGGGRPVNPDSQLQKYLQGKSVRDAEWEKSGGVGPRPNPSLFKKGHTVNKSIKSTKSKPTPPTTAPLPWTNTPQASTSPVNFPSPSAASRVSQQGSSSSKQTRYLPYPTPVSTGTAAPVSFSLRPPLPPLRLQQSSQPASMGVSPAELFKQTQQLPPQPIRSVIGQPSAQFSSPAPPATLSRSQRSSQPASMGVSPAELFKQIQQLPSVSQPIRSVIGQPPAQYSSPLAPGPLPSVRQSSQPVSTGVSPSNLFNPSAPAVLPSLPARPSLPSSRLRPQQSSQPAPRGGPSYDLLTQVQQRGSGQSSTQLVRPTPLRRPVSLPSWQNPPGASQ